MEKSYTDYKKTEAKIRKAQAFNLAVSTAISEGKVLDNEYIFKQTFRYMELLEIIQEGNKDHLVSLVKAEPMLKLLEQLKEMSK